MAMAVLPGYGKSDTSMQNKSQYGPPTLSALKSRWIESSMVSSPYPQPLHSLIILSRELEEDLASMEHLIIAEGVLIYCRNLYFKVTAYIKRKGRSEWGEHASRSKQRQHAIL